MSLIIALIVAGILFLYWRVALAIVLMIVIALVILGIVAVLQGNPVAPESMSANVIHSVHGAPLGESAGGN